jgi:uncharacterized protein (TIGR02145 family)
MKSILLILSVFLSSILFSQSKHLKELKSERDSLIKELEFLKKNYETRINKLQSQELINKKRIYLLERELKYSRSASIGSTNWMTFNLDVTTFRNGDSIPWAQTDEEWEAAGFNQKPAWCYYKNEDGTIDTTFGKLYNRYALIDSRGLAPDGWKIASHQDWIGLQDFLYRTDYHFEDLVPSPQDLTTPGLTKLNLNFAFTGWRDVGCSGLGNDVTYWLEPDWYGDSESTPTVSFSRESNQSGYFRNYSKDLWVFGNTSWIMGHYVRCVRD